MVLGVLHDPSLMGGDLAACKFFGQIYIHLEWSSFARWPQWGV